VRIDKLEDMVKEKTRVARMMLRDADGRVSAIEARGWEHFWKGSC
jgi:hypothetical protein